MKLRTYRINYKGYSKRKREFFKALYYSVLKRDLSWHFFLDPEGGTLRFDPKNEKRVKKWLVKHAKNWKVRYRKRTLYTPRRHEYFGVSFLADDLIPLFNHMSVLSVHYPNYVLVTPVLERLTHGLVNMAGVHDFKTEAYLYMDLAYGRMDVAQSRFKVPKKLQKFYFRLSRLWKKEVS